MSVVFLLIVAYFVVLIFIGWFTRKKVSTFKDYALAGRKVGSFYLSSTILATFLGGGTLIGLTGRIAESGISNY